MQPIILHIDDDADDRQLVSETINKIDQSVIVKQAHNGDTGLNVLHELQKEHQIPSLIILDINMPGKTGSELAKEIRQHTVFKNIPIILFSTARSIPDESFFEKENIPLVAKPNNLSDLETVIKSFLNEVVMHSKYVTIHD